MGDDANHAIELVNHAMHIGAWFWGLLLTIIVVAMRNEWTTAKMDKALFDKDGDLRLMKTQDCSDCRESCRRGIEVALAETRRTLELDRTETKADLLRLHEKIDDLPQRIIVLLKTTIPG